MKGRSVVPDGVVAVFIGNNPDGGGNLFLTGKPIGFFQIQEQIVHIRVRDGGADAVVADGLYNVHSLGQQIFAIAPKAAGHSERRSGSCGYCCGRCLSRCFPAWPLLPQCSGRGCFLYGLSAACRILGGKLCHSSFKIAHFLSIVNDKDCRSSISGEQHIQQIFHMGLLLARLPQKSGAMLLPVS